MTPTDLDRLLGRVASTPRLLVALDFDGTLSPLVDDPMSARMLPAARDAVAALTAAPATTVALVSGRSIPDLRIIAEHTDDSPVLLAGSHGAEVWTPGEGRRATPDDPADERLRDDLQARAESATADMPGVWIEPKTFGLGVHTRRADAATAEAARAVVDALVAPVAGHWRRRKGHDILEFSFRHEGKDAAIAQLRGIVGATAVVFAGDDVTDEDALESLRTEDLGIHVGDRPTAAAVSVPDIPALAVLLDRLAERRAAVGGGHQSG
jgi:trehalose 6-phosphate phosphatase